MSRINLSDCKLLLAEDDPDEVIRLRYALKVAELNPPFWVARDGEEAIEFLKRETDDDIGRSGPTLLFLDLQMPRKNGFEVLEWIRQQPELGRLIVIVLTGSDNSNDERRAYALGASSYAVKPGNLQSLAELVKTLLTFRLYWDGSEKTRLELFESAPA